MIRSVIVSLTSAAVLSAACGGSGPGRETANTTTANRTITASDSGKPGGTVSEGNKADLANPSPADTNTSPRVKRSDAIRQAAGDQPRQPVDIEAVLKQSTRPAPEDSEFSVALTDIVVERRTFNRHALLAKVEKVTEGEKSTIYVFTKDGSKRELPGASIPSLSTAPSSAILQGIGMSPQRPRVSDSKSKAASKN